MEPMEMKAFVQAIIEDSGFHELQVNFQVTRQSVNYHQQTISLSPHRVYQNAERMQLDVTTYLLFSVTHAIGQYVVSKNDKGIRQRKTCLRAAWLHSRPFIPTHYLEQYNQFNMNLINNFRGGY